MKKKKIVSLGYFLYYRKMTGELEFHFQIFLRNRKNFIDLKNYTTAKNARKSIR